MSPSGKSSQSNRDDQQTEALDAAARKLEEKGFDPSKTPGGAIRQGFKEGA